MEALATIAALVALLVLFVAGLRAPLGHGRTRIVVRTIGVMGALVAVALTNLVAFRHDKHFDLTRDAAFTPAPETLSILRNLEQDVELVYFYQAQNPAGLAAKHMVEIMGKESSRLTVRTVDPDQHPAVANQLGVRMYNAALLLSGDRRLEVITTDDREIAAGIVRLLRRDARPICFLTGHGEYAIDNFEFHTHFEGSHAHSHDAGGMAIVKMDLHGIGRLRRALEKLGYTARKLNLTTTGVIPGECAAVVGANPRTPFSPPEVGLLERYLEEGGNLLLLLEPDYALGGEIAALLARAGIRVDDGVVVDPASHYYTDEQMVAVEKYPAHPSTLGLALTVFPGARPLSPIEVARVKSAVLFSSSPQSTVVPLSQRTKASLAEQHGVVGARPLAIAVEGKLDAMAKPFRLAVVGDADFASNSFYPYLGNADLVLGLVAWLRGEPRGPAMKPPVEVLPTVAMTQSQMQAVFVICVPLLPGMCAALGLLVWWRRRY